MSIQPVQSFKEMSTAKKAAVVAGATAAAAGIAATTAAYIKGRGVKAGDEYIKLVTGSTTGEKADKIRKKGFKKVEGQEDTLKFGQKIRAGYKKMFDGVKNGFSKLFKGKKTEGQAPEKEAPVAPKAEGTAE